MFDERADELEELTLYEAAQALQNGLLAHATDGEISKADYGLLRSRLMRGARVDLRGRVLDVCDGAAVSAFAAEIELSHGGVDIVVSNAAARLYPGAPTAELVGPFVDTNNLGATRMLRAFGPLLRPGGRLLVVASSFGTLRALQACLHGRFETEVMTLDDLDAVVLEWRGAVEEGRAVAEGWPKWINVPSKVGQVAAVRILARERREGDLRDGTVVAAVCPGLIDTDASRPWFDDMSAAQSPIEAAVPLLRLALHPADPRLHGELVQFGKVLPWR